MSVGPGKILVFTADNLSPKKKKKNTGKGPPPDRPKPAKPPAQVSGPSATSTPSAKGRPPPLEPIRAKLRLVLSEKQKARMETLFLAPKALAVLLRAYPQKLQTQADASVFLLSNRKALDGCINPAARERAIDLLTELLLLWSGNPPDSLGIEFEDASLTPDQKVFLPLEGLRGVEVAEPLQLQQQRRGRRFLLPFTLFQEEKQFFVSLTLEPTVQGSTPAGAFKKDRAKNLPGEIQLQPGQPLPYISGLRNPPREPRQRVLYSKYSGVFSGGIKAMNWGDLSGWGVNGGLPSLGKGSR